MLHRLCSDFYIPGNRAMVQDWVRTCVTCQRKKTEALQPAELLQPLDILSQVWADISMDFIEGLLDGKSVILTVVDRFSKYAHFIVLGHPYTATSIARTFFAASSAFTVSNVYRQRPGPCVHWPCGDLFRMAGMTLRMCTAFHPQMDDQSEVVNKVIAMYLCCYW